MRFLLKWLINIIALFLVIHIVAGVSADNWQTIAAAAFVIGLLNTFLRPFMIIVTLPLTILTFGFFTLLINTFIFYLAAKFIKGFVVAGFANAFWASLVFSIISFILNTFLAPDINFRINAFRQPVDTAPRKRHDDAIDVEGKVEK